MRLTLKLRSSGLALLIAAIASCTSSPQGAAEAAAGGQAAPVKQRLPT